MVTERLALGEANTASSSGAGASLIQTKVASDLPFRSIAGTDGLIHTQNTDDVTLTLDITGLTGEATADDADSVAIYDSSAAANRRMAREDFLGDVLRHFTSADSVTAANGGSPVQGDGAQTANFINVTVVANVADVITMPAVQTYSFHVVTNDGVNQLFIYPISGEYINAGAQNAGQGLDAGARAFFWYQSSGKWRMIVI